ncbi:MAG: tRNA-specific 2-thiouridylase [Alistipes sp.]|nr:tRNA-specific 2-thiouridylase [Alistipes sp.]
MGKSVVLGFSGGIDSITSASLLRDAGWRVIAVTLDTIGDEIMLSKARESAATLGVEHHIVDVKSEFQQLVVDYFIDSYSSGRTPAPCTVCNSAIKWRFLAEAADRLGVEHIATGHYFSVVSHKGLYYVARGADPAKDQSYYLWGLKQDILSRIITPMSDKIKAEVKLGFEDKRESMGVCFLRGVNYRDFICSHRPSLAAGGNVVDANGKVVGSHDGFAFYTIGQKRGFALAAEMPGAAIVGIDAVRNELRVGRNDELLKLTLEVEKCNVVSESELLSAEDISVVIRGIGRNPEGFARSIQPCDGGYKVELSHPAWAAAAGQPVVFYRCDRVIGGGFLRRCY